jgi:hypothetical protein
MFSHPFNPLTAPDTISHIIFVQQFTVKFRSAALAFAESAVICSLFRKLLFKCRKNALPLVIGHLSCFDVSDA